MIEQLHSERTRGVETNTIIAIFFSCEQSSFQWCDEPMGSQLNHVKMETGNPHQSITVPPSPCEFQYFLGGGEGGEGLTYRHSFPPRINNNSSLFNDASARPYPTYNQLQKHMPFIPPCDSREAEVQTPMNQFSKEGTNSSPQCDSSQMSYRIKTRPRRKRPRLCHFILELLANPEEYSNIVEWVDQKNGVFKFLNSSEIASQWGKRRDKPHMKYENFARSLRTYIAKGIMSKPRSRLVYQFTDKIL